MRMGSFLPFGKCFRMTVSALLRAHVSFAAGMPQRLNTQLSKALLFKLLLIGFHDLLHPPRFPKAGVQRHSLIALGLFSIVVVKPDGDGIFSFVADLDQPCLRS